MSEMVERVAEALWDLHQKDIYVRVGSNAIFYGEEWHGKTVPWSHVCSEVVVPSIAESYRAQARTAIAALREPTQAMLNASPVVGTGPDEKGNWTTNTTPARIVWYAMSDEALK